MAKSSGDTAKALASSGPLGRPPGPIKRRLSTMRGETSPDPQIYSHGRNRNGSNSHERLTSGQCAYSRSPSGNSVLSRLPAGISPDGSPGQLTHSGALSTHVVPSRPVAASLLHALPSQPSHSRTQSGQEGFGPLSEQQTHQRNGTAPRPGPDQHTRSGSGVNAPSPVLYAPSGPNEGFRPITQEQFDALRMATRSRGRSRGGEAAMVALANEQQRQRDERQRQRDGQGKR